MESQGKTIETSDQDVISHLCDSSFVDICIVFFSVWGVGGEYLP